MAFGNNGKNEEEVRKNSLEIMYRIDRQCTKHPEIATRQMVDYLKAEGYCVGREFVYRLMRLMDIRPSTR